MKTLLPLFEFLEDYKLLLFELLDDCDYYYWFDFEFDYEFEFEFEFD